MEKTTEGTSTQDSVVRPDVISSISNSAIATDPVPSAISSTNDANTSGVFPDQTLISAALGGEIDEVGSNSNNSSDDNAYQQKDDDSSYESDDEIIREIDVYISPELARTMYLIQFPLQTASHTVIPSTKQNKKNSQHRQPPLTQTEPPIPNAARIKPEHALLELDYSVPTYSFSNQRSVPEVLDLSTRTHTSSEIPITTHMALGLFDDTGTKIDLVPLHRILQMRPSFKHIDAVFDDDDLLSKQAQAEDGKKKEGSNPILFKKSESERTVQIRESSYAHKRACEEKEEWLTLDVHGMRSVGRREAMKKFYCSKEEREVDLKFAKPGKVGGGTGYVKSLNYLPNVNFEEDAEEDFVKPVAGVGEKERGLAVVGEDEDEDNMPMDEDGEEGDTESSFHRELTDRIAKLLQGRGGVPIPFPVIRSRYHPSVTDEDLLQATSASAVLVRGNFLLKSSLLGLTSPHVANARDLILILLNKYGFVQHDKLKAVYESLDEVEDIAKIIVTEEILGALLNLVGRKTLNGVELKVDDDPTIEAYFGKVAKKHNDYWKSKEALLTEYVGLYEDQM